MAQPTPPTGSTGPAPRAAHAEPHAAPERRLDARKGDPECLFGLPAGTYTNVAAPFWFMVASVLTIVSALVIVFALRNTYFYELINRCWTNWVVMLLTWWCLLMLYAKWTKTNIQRKALKVNDLIPRRGDFVLSPGTAGDVLRRVRATCERPKDFLLFRRITMALSNLDNLGEVRDVGMVLESQGDSDASSVDSSYTVIRALIWTIPILGFIGTVIGLSNSIRAFTDVLNTSASDASSIKAKLQPVVGGLATEFETTLVALMTAVVIQLLATWVFRREEIMLDEVTDYCNENVLSRLKLTDWR
jgi:MotA/TolQ/ExbB proton channel family